MINWKPTVFVRETADFRATVMLVHGKHSRWEWAVFQRPGRGPSPFGHGQVPCKSGNATTAEEAGRQATAAMGIEDPRESPREATPETFGALSDVFGIVPRAGVMRAPCFITEDAARAAAKTLDRNPRSTDPMPIGIAHYQLKEVTSL